MFNVQRIRGVQAAHHGDNTVVRSRRGWAVVNRDHRAVVFWSRHLGEACEWAARWQAPGAAEDVLRCHKGAVLKALMAWAAYRKARG